MPLLQAGRAGGERGAGWWLAAWLEEHAAAADGLLLQDDFYHAMGQAGGTTEEPSGRCEGRWCCMQRVRRPPDCSRHKVHGLLLGHVVLVPRLEHRHRVQAAAKEAGSACKRQPDVCVRWQAPDGPPQTPPRRSGCSRKEGRQGRQEAGRAAACLRAGTGCIRLYPVEPGQIVRRKAPGWQDLHNAAAAFGLLHTGEGGKSQGETQAGAQADGPAGDRDAQLCPACVQAQHPPPAARPTHLPLPMVQNGRLSVDPWG